MAKVDEFKDKLLGIESELSRRLDAIKQDVRNETNPISADSAEQATERENDEVVDALGQSAQSELVLVKRALQRIEDGEYFECTACGEPIDEGRLRSVPYTSLCISCAEDMENTQKGQKDVA